MLKVEKVLTSKFLKDVIGGNKFHITYTRPNGKQYQISGANGRIFTPPGITSIKHLKDSINSRLGHVLKAHRPFLDK